MGRGARAAVPHYQTPAKGQLNVVRVVTGVTVVPVVPGDINTSSPHQHQHHFVRNRNEQQSQKLTDENNARSNLKVSPVRLPQDHFERSRLASAFEIQVNALTIAKNNKLNLIA
jgi:hypothetical protein